MTIQIIKIHALIKRGFLLCEQGGLVLLPQCERFVGDEDEGDEGKDKR